MSSLTDTLNLPAPDYPFRYKNALFEAVIALKGKLHLFDGSEYIVTVTSVEQANGEWAAWLDHGCKNLNWRDE